MAKALLREALDNPGLSDPVLRCRLLSWLGRAFFLNDGNVTACLAHLAEARELARQTADKQSLQDILSTEMAVAPTPVAGEFDQRRRTIRQYFESSLLNTDPFMAMYDVGLSAGRFLEIGDIDGFHTALKHMAELARTTQAAGDRWLSQCFEAVSALLAGDYGKAERAAEDAYSAVKDATVGPFLGIYGMQMFTIRRDQGRLA